MENLKTYEIQSHSGLAVNKKNIKWNKLKCFVFEKLVFIFAVLSALMIIFIFAFILQKAWHVLSVNGMHFVTKSGFDAQVQDAYYASASEPVLKFGVLGLLIGTLTTTLGALAIAVPMGIATAVFISEVSKGWLKSFMQSAVRLLAAIPSVIYGFIGLIVIVPFIRGSFITVDTQIEYMEYFQLTGRSMLAGILVLSIMILPFIVALSVDAINAVPKKYKEAALSLGMTKWRTIIKVILPSAKSGIIAGAILGAGRAVGEAIALSMVSGSIGNLPNLKHGGVFFLTPVLPLASAIVNKSEAISVPSIESALFGCGVVLLITTTILSVSTKIVNKMVRRRQGLE